MTRTHRSSALARRLPAALLLAALGCSRAEPTVVIGTAKGPARFAVEIAADEPSRERGLMYRNDLAADRGMLFVFDTEEEHAFWMKNTLIPLDMIFIAADAHIAGIHENATPLSLAPISVGRPSRWVLEVRGGEAQRQGLHTGDRVDLPPAP